MAAGAIRTPDQRLRVFVSSTLGELAEERGAVRRAIEQLRLSPVLFELGARPHPPRALYRSYLEQSDVFVGIYWQRYGWVAPGMAVSGLEDELVLSEGMPRLVYVKRPAPDMEPQLAGMLERLTQGDTASYKAFGDADELHDLLLDDLAVLLTERFDGPPAAPPSAPVPSHDLPAPTSTFLGRRAELDELHRVIASGGARLVTLTGPGGTGKTRLAVEAARAEVDRFTDGVVFVDLSEERDVDGVFAAVARALGVAVPGDVRPLSALQQELRDRCLLLVLDNVEQVTPAAVGIVELLERCPALQVLVTSREVLRVRGERVLQVSPLPLPGPGGDLPASSVAVQLFCERAAAARPAFRCDETNAEVIADLCRRLDGLPLAIELAAARVQVFDVEELGRRLEDRLDVARGGLRDLPARQQTLHAAIAWSYDLLDEEERRVLGLFTVFADGRLGDLEATAARVPALAGIDVAAAIGSLLDKSLLQSRPGWDGRSRFTVLRTIRTFVQERTGDVPEVRLAHAEHFTEAVTALHRGTTSAARRDVLSTLADELGNLRAAWDEWRARASVTGLKELLSPLWGFYEARGDYRSAIELGNDLLAQLVAAPDSQERRRDEIAVRTSVVRTQLAVKGYTAEAERLVREAVARAGADGDVRRRFPGLRSLLHLQLMQANLAETDVLAHELLDMAEEERDPVLLTEAHTFLAMTTGWREDLPPSLEHIDLAIEHFEASRSGHVDFRTGPNPGVVAHVVAGMGRWLVGLPEGAEAALGAALELAFDLDHPWSMAYALFHAGLLDLWRQDLARVAERADALSALAGGHDYPMWRALADVLAGSALVGLGRVAAGLDRLDEGFALYQGLSTPPIFWSGLLVIRARALVAAGRAPEALALVEEAEAAVRPGDQMELDVGIARGDVLLSLSPPDVAGAEARFERVAALAGERGALMAGLQARTRLVVLRRGGPGEAEALEALRAVHDRFTEGGDAGPLLAARAALGPPGGAGAAGGEGG